MYNNLFSYVKSYLEDHSGQVSQVGSGFRVRSDHIKRVYQWVMRLIEDDIAPIRTTELLTAVIFHDVGYGTLVEKESHAINSARIFRQYAVENGYESEKIEFICYLIENHSNKELLGIPGTAIELVLLMEADLLDETGALSIVWDCMTEGANKVQSFGQTYEHILKYSGRMIDQNPMVTDKGKQYWREKQNLTRTFIEQLAIDIEGPSTL